MGTQVDFYFNSPHRFDTALKLAVKVWEAGESLLVLFPDSEYMSEWDMSLWTFSDIVFIPHCPLDHPLAIEAKVWLSVSLPPHQSSDVILNLANFIWDNPKGLADYSRIVEIVDQDVARKEEAREAYRRYREHGFSIHNHDVTTLGLDESANT